MSASQSNLKAPVGHILLVDDNPHNLLALEAVLAPLGRPLTSVNSGERALDELSKREFSVVLLDMRMPGLDGITTAHRMRQNEQTRHVPVIFLTADGYDELTLESVYRHGAADFLTKPFQPAVLRAKVEVFVQLFERARRIEHQEAELLAAERERQAYARLEAALAEANAANHAMDEFLAVVSHELRTPLNAILGSGQLLCSGTLNESLVAKAAETIVRNARTQAKIIEDILDVSRIVRGSLRLEIRALDLAELIEAALDSVRPAAAAKHIELSTNLERDATHVVGDPERLQQVIWNLANNAIKFTPQHGRVNVRLRRVNSYVELRVADTGQGIPPEFLPHAFERFRQAESATTRRHGGLGLGLALVRHLVEAHGGRVRAESAGEGKGTQFYVTLPSQGVHVDSETEPADPASASFPVATPVVSLKGISVLAVDDDQDARELITTFLELHGASVVTADSAETALRLIEQERPQVLVSDIGMPGMDGYKFIEVLRSSGSELAQIPAIALTAFARKEDRLRAERAGFQKYATKPVDRAHLVDLVASLVRRNAAE